MEVLILKIAWDNHRDLYPLPKGILCRDPIASSHSVHAPKHGSGWACPAWWISNVSKSLLNFRTFSHPDTKDNKRWNCWFSLACQLSSALCHCLQIQTPVGSCQVHPSSAVHFSFSTGIIKPHGISVDFRCIFHLLKRTWGSQSLMQGNRTHVLC